MIQILRALRIVIYVIAIVAGLYATASCTIVQSFDYNNNKHLHKSHSYIKGGQYYDRGGRAYRK